MCFLRVLGVWGGGGGSKGLKHNFFMQFFTLGSSKIKVSETFFWRSDIWNAKKTTHHEHPSYGKHVSANIDMFFTYVEIRWGGGGLPRDWYTTCCCSFSPWTAEKLKFLQIFVFDFMTTHIEHPSHAKHVLGNIYVFFYEYWVCIARGRFSARPTC